MSLDSQRRNFYWVAVLTSSLGIFFHVAVIYKTANDIPTQIGVATITLAATANEDAYIFISLHYLLESESYVIDLNISAAANDMEVIAELFPLERYHILVITLQCHCHHLSC